MNKLYSETERCQKKVMWDSWHSKQCDRKGVVVRDGVRYCKQHDPVAVKAKVDEKHRQWEERFAKTMAAFERQKLEKEYCAGLSDEELGRRVKSGEVAK